MSERRPPLPRHPADLGFPPGHLADLEFPVWPQAPGYDGQDPDWRHVECLANPLFRYRGRRIELRFTENNGRVVLVGLEIGPHRSGHTLGFAIDDDLKPLHTAELRLPLAKIVEDLWERHAIRLAWNLETPVGSPHEERMREIESLDLDTKIATFRDEARKRIGRPPQYDKTHYLVVETVYREHENSGGRAPTQAVADYFKVTRSTAAKWVATARAKYGLLQN